jgi:hypothetical protein
MSYQVYERSATRVEEPSVSIGSSGAMRLNAAASRLMQRSNVRYVLLLWDKDNQRIAFKSTVKSDKNAYAISMIRHSGSIRAKSFLAHIGWNAPRRQMLSATWNEKERMLEVRLPKKWQQTARQEIA